MRLSLRPILGASFPQQYRQLVDPSDQPTLPGLIIGSRLFQQLRNRAGQTIGVHGVLGRRLNQQAIPRAGPVVVPRLVELVRAGQRARRVGGDRVALLELSPVEIFSGHHRSVRGQCGSGSKLSKWSRPSRGHGRSTSPAEKTDRHNFPAALRPRMVAIRIRTNWTPPLNTMRRA